MGLEDWLSVPRKATGVSHPMSKSRNKIHVDARYSKIYSNAADHVIQFH